MIKQAETSVTKDDAAEIWHNAPPAARALVEQARRNDGPSAPRKHHLVPASYLTRWTDEKKIRVTEVDSGRSYLCAPAKAARETDFYRIESEDVDPHVLPPLFEETLLSRVEARGKQAIDELLVKQPWEVNDPELMAGFVWYLGFQHARGRAYRQTMRDSVADFGRVTIGSLTEAHMRRRLEENGDDATPEAVAEIREVVEQFRNGRLIVQPQDAAIIGNSGQVADAAGEHFLNREWIVYRTPPMLVTCDEPVVTIGGPGFDRTKWSGLDRAGVVVFPLSPTAVLVMFRRDIAPARPNVTPQLDRIETTELNREIIGNASRWVFERPGRKVGLGIKVPPRLRHSATQEIPTSNKRERLIRAYMPTRWANTDHPPPWPVARWWN